MENKIRTTQELQRDVNELKTREDLLLRVRKETNANIKSIRQQVETLEEMILNNNQFELFNV